MLARSGTLVFALKVDSGDVQWSVDLGAATSSSLVLTRGGKLFAGMADPAKNVLFDTAYDYAASAWPKIHGNRRNTRRTNERLSVMF